MLISVIIPVYKPQKYFEACVKSLLYQSIDKKLVQIIFVLNGYVDRELVYVKEVISLLKTTDYVVTLLLVAKSGVSLARNKGLDAAKGKYICFIDDDDIISQNYLQSFLGKAGNEIVVVSDVKTFVNDIAYTEEDYISRAYAKFYHNRNHSLFAMRSFLSSACCKMIPISMILERRFNPAIKNGEDALFMFTISDKIKKIELADDAIYYRRCREGSASRTYKGFFVKCNRFFAVAFQ